MKTKKGAPAFRSFDTAMQLVDRGGRMFEWAWVRNSNVDVFVGET